MSFNPNKLTFKVDEVTGEIIQPQVLLCDRQLNKLGEIYPVNNLRIKANLNGADEVSFSTPRQSSVYDEIKDYSIIFVRGFGYFEVSPTVSDTFIESKNVQGSSLGETELSQLLCTLECNTEDDMKYSEGDIYIPTILYNPDSTEHSLIHRILSDSAPNYEVGHVDPTIRNCQRTFSFSNTDIISCFNQIAEEIGCIFDVVVEKSENGEVHRTVNIYDTQYCGECGKRNIVNGICQDCGSTDICGIGDDTTIQISTDNLSDEITLSSDGSMKNCFIVVGGDDLMTNAVEGINPSGNNKIYMFSEETMNSFSPELRERYKEYVKEYDGKKDEYAEIFEIQSNISDLILYLQSGRMPSVETAEKTLKEETRHVLDSFQTNFPNGLGLIDGTDTSSRNSMIRQIFTLFLDSGYAIKQENGKYHSDNDKKYWTGNLILYEIQNNDSKATIMVDKNESTISYSDSDEIITESFCIRFTEENWEAFVKQEIALTTDLYKDIQALDRNNAKDWQKYSLNRLISYKDGYLSCRLALEEIKKKSGLNGVNNTADEMIKEYNTQIAEISKYTSRLEDMIYYLHSYHGIDNTAFSPSAADMDYTSSDDETHLSSCETAFQDMVHYIKYGTWLHGDESSITDTPLYCSSCGSTSVTLSGCNICKGEVITYSDIAQNVVKHYQQSSNGKNLQTQRKAIQDSLNLQRYLWDKHQGDAYYKELCSFIREDVYTNSNFISAGMETNNTKLVSHAKELLQKAQLELEKACVPQHTLTGNVYAFVAFSSLNPEDFPIQNAYDNFKLGNFLRYISDDGTVYKLRLSSEEFSWDDSGASLNVEFTDVIQYANGSFSDIESLIQHVGNLSTSFDSVKKQAEQGEKAGRTFTDIKNEGLYSALGNVLNARNQDVQITEDGITLRKYDYELDDYDDCQMKLINRNIVMTDDGWKNAKMAIGLGRHDGELKYGVWADLLVGDMIVGKELVIKNDKDDNKSSVLINENGIKITNGKIDMQNDTFGIHVKIDPADYKVFEIQKNDLTILGFDEQGNAFFNGNIEASGYSGGAVIAEEKIEFKKYYDNSDLYSYFLVGDGNSTDPVYMTISYPNGNNFTVNQNGVNITGLDLIASGGSSIKLMAKGTDIWGKDDGNIEIEGNRVNIHGRVKYSNNSWISKLTVSDKNTYVTGQKIYIGTSSVEDNSVVKIDGDTYIATELEASNCYIGSKYYNYGIVEKYTGTIFDRNKIDLENTIVYLQKLGRIVVLSAIIVLKQDAFTTTEILNEGIGVIPEEYRHSDETIVSCGNSSAFGECYISKYGVIRFSCNNKSVDYQLHGVWFLE